MSNVSATRPTTDSNAADRAEVRRAEGVRRRAQQQHRREAQNDNPPPRARERGRGARVDKYA